MDFGNGVHKFIGDVAAIASCILGDGAGRPEEIDRGHSVAIPSWQKCISFLVLPEADFGKVQPPAAGGSC